MRKNTWISTELPRLSDARPGTPGRTRATAFSAMGCLVLFALAGCRVSGEVQDPAPELQENPPPVAVDWTSSVVPSPTPASETASSSSAEASTSSSAASGSSSSAASAASSSSSASVAVTPTITQVLPTGGPLTGGTSVTFVGTGFSNDAAIRATLVGVACASVTVVSDTQLTCVTGAASAAGAGTAAVTRSDGGQGTLASAFTYETSLRIDSVTPDGGRLAGGTTLTLTGVRFASGMAVTVGGSTCASVTVANSTQATCLTPASGLATTQSVTVTHPDGQTASLASAYAYHALPTLTSVAPSTATISGGIPITLSGTGFLAGATVTVGGASCPVPASGSSASVTCTAPAGSAGAASVVLTNLDTQAATLVSGFTYGVAPTFASITPSSGRLSGGQSLTIAGSGFGASTTARLDSTDCPVASYTATSLVCTSPAHAAGAVDVVLANGASIFSVTSASAFTYNALPTISGVSPATSGTGGGVVATISGSGFLAGVAATVGGTACSTLVRDSSSALSCTVPAKSVGSHDIVVTNTDTQSVTSVGAMSYVNGPTFASVSPTSGKLAGGTSITIAGSNFSTGSAPSVTISGSACTVGSNSATQIVCTTPAKSAGNYDILITNSDNTTATGSGAYTYNPFPTTSSVSPTAGTTAGGTSITIAGTGFILGTGFQITVDGNTCTVPGGNATLVSCVTPSGTAGSKNVVVTNPDTQSVTTSFNYLQAPTLSSVSPPAGALAGGFTLTLSGSNFTTDSPPTVNVAGTDCPVASNNATTVTCTAPAKSAGTYNVQILISNGTTGTIANTLTYQAGPTFASITPAIGNPSGGLTVTIAGTNFRTGVSATIGGSSCANLVRNSSSEIVCDTPALGAGAKNVVVTNTDTQSATGTSAFEVIGAPSLTSVSLNNGKLAGGVTVTINGSSFYNPPSAISIGGSSCGSIAFVDSSHVTCSTPAKSAGSYAVIVTHPAGASATLSSGYTYNPIPTLSSISPTLGLTDGGSAVTIAGTGFLSGAAVTMGGSACSNINVVSGTEIRCDTPAHAAGVTSITITNADTQSGSLSNAFEFNTPPTQLALGAPSTVAKDSCTTALSVTLLDSGAAATRTVSARGITLSGAANGSFYSSSGCTGGTEITALTIASGSSTGSFYYKNTIEPQTITIAVASGALTGASSVLAITTATPWLKLSTTDKVFRSNALDQLSALSVDIANWQTGSATDSGMTYDCVFDRVADAAVSGSTSCTTLSGTASFTTGTGILNWTPDRLAWGPYELKFTGTNGTGSGTKTFTIDARELYPTTNLLANLDAQFGAVSGQVTSGSSATWADLTSNAYNGELTGNNVTGWKGAGTVASPYSVSLDGSASFRVNMGAANTNLTQVMFNTWVKPTSPATAGAVILGNVGGGTNGFVLRQSASVANKVELAVGIGSGTYSYGASVTTLGPSHYWRLGEPSGSTSVTDMISGVVGTRSGTATAGAQGVMSTVDSNTSVTLDGTGDYYTMGSISIATGANPASFCGWASTRDLAHDGRFFAYGTGTDDKGIVLGQKSSTLLAGFSGAQFEVTGFWTATGTWRHVCLTHDGLNVKLYGDGALVAQEERSTIALTNTSAYIGRGLSAGYEWSGEVDEIAAWRRALNPSEISLLYSSGKAKLCRSSTSLSSSQWTHLAGVFNGSVLQLLVNGKPECAIGATDDFSSPSTDFYVGGTSAGANLWQGQIGHVAVASSGSVTSAMEFYRATAPRFQSGTENQAPNIQLSVLKVGAPYAPADGVARDAILAIPRNADGTALGRGRTLELSWNSTATVTVSGQGSCQTPSAYCTRMKDAGGGTYLASAYTGSANSVTFSATAVNDVYGDSYPVGTSQVIQFDDTYFTSPLGKTTTTATTITSGDAGLNIYVKSGSTTFDESTVGVTFGNIYLTASNNGLLHKTSTASTAYRFDVAAESFQTHNGKAYLYARGYTANTSYASNQSTPSSVLGSTIYGGGSHGGRGGIKDGSSVSGATFDDVRDPRYPGGGACASNAGGGVFRVRSPGVCFFSGTGSVDATAAAAAAGGTINLSCAYNGTDVGWTGSLNTSGGNGNVSCGGGGGGRISVTTSNGAEGLFGSFTYPTQSLELSEALGAFNASGGANYSSGTHGSGGSGTVYLKHAGLTYGGLIVNNKSTVSYVEKNSITELPSLAGTLNGAPSGTTANVSVTSSPGLPAGFVDNYRGLSIRPNLSATNGTPNDPTDDQIVTLTGNSLSAITTSVAITGASGGEAFRSIYVFDHIHLGEGAYLSSASDIYVKNGTFSGGTSATLLGGGLYSMAGNATFTYPGYQNLTIMNVGAADSGGFSGVDLRSTGTTLLALTINSGEVRNVPSGTSFPGVALFNGGVLTSTGALSLSAITMSATASTLTTSTLSVTGAFNLAVGTITADQISAVSITQSGGTITHAAPTAGEIRRLSITLSGDLNQSAGYIDVSANGWKGYGPGNGTGSTALRSVSSTGGSHGGLGGYSATVSSTNVGPVYGDYRDPDLPGACNVSTYSGGGVARINAAGTCLINGTIQSVGGNGCAGGSVMVHCASITGSGNVYAYGGAGLTTSYGGGGGGRIALIVDGNATAFQGGFVLPTSQSTFDTFVTNVRASGGTSSSGWGGGGPGTIYYRHSGSTYGNLIINNFSTTVNEWNGHTRMLGLAGTVNGAPGASSMPVSVTSTPGLTANYTNLYKGLRVRPNLAFTNGTGSDWTDDGVVTISSNDNATLTFSSSLSGVSNGDAFRSIDILDSIYIGNGAILESAGDIYSLLGNPIANNSAIYSVPGIYLLEGGAGFTYPSYTNVTAFDIRSSGFVATGVSSFSSTGATLDSIGVSGGNVTVNGNFSQPGGTLSVTGSTLTVNGDVTVGTLSLKASSVLTATNVSVTLYNQTGGTATISSLSAATYAQSAGILTHPVSTTLAINRLIVNATSSFSLGGSGKIDVDVKGYPAGYSFGGPSAPSTAITSVSNGGGSHAGRGGYKTDPLHVGDTYDNPLNPYYPGGGGRTAIGGGVVAITVTGPCTLGSSSAISANADYQASGGTVRMKCASFAASGWTGSINASGGTVQSTFAAGGGGMVYLESTGNETTWTGNLPFPSPTNTPNTATFRARVKAQGGAGTATYGNGGAGTIFVKHSGLTYGDLLVSAGNISTTYANDGYTSLTATTVNGGVLYGSPDANTATVTNGGTPFAGLTDLFKGIAFDIYSTGNASHDPSAAGHTSITMDSGSGSNTLSTTAGTVPAINNDYYYRTLYHLDHLDIQSKGKLHVNGGTIWLEACDLHTTGSTTLDVPSGSTLSGFALKAPTCTTKNTSGTTQIFTNTY